MSGLLKNKDKKDKDKKEKEKKATLKKGQIPSVPSSGSTGEGSPATRAWKSKLTAIQTQNAADQEAASKSAGDLESSTASHSDKKALPVTPKVDSPKPIVISPPVGPPTDPPPVLHPVVSALNHDRPSSAGSSSSISSKTALFESLSNGGSSASTSSLPFCSKCNVTLRETAKFCTKCGGPIKRSTEAPGTSLSRNTTQNSTSAANTPPSSPPPSHGPPATPPTGSSQPPSYLPPAVPSGSGTGTPTLERSSTGRDTSSRPSVPERGPLERQLTSSSQGKSPPPIPDKTQGRNMQSSNGSWLERSQSEVRKTIHGGKRPQRASEVARVKVTGRTDQGGKQESVLATSAPAQAVKTGPENDKRRQMIVGELVSTEKTYVSGLRELCTKYRTPILDYIAVNPKAPEVHLAADLFSNVDSILGISEIFLSDLEKVFEKWSPQSTIGNIITKTAPFFKLYSAYSKNYGTAAKALDKLVSIEWFSKFVPDRLLLDSLFILPIQRIPRYRLLVEDFIKSTPPNHPDYAELNSSLVLIKDAASYVNAGIDEQSNDLIGLNLMTHLMEPHRRLVRVGTMHITTILRYDNTDEKPEKKNKKNLKKPYLFFLFNDILAVVKERKEFNEAAHSSLRGKKTTKGTWDDKDDINWPLELTWVCDLKKEKNVFEFEIKGPMKTITVSTTEAEKGKWMSSLMTTIQSVLVEIDPKVGPDAASELVRREGTYKFPSGAIYAGWWDLGRMHPYGCYEYKGTYYEGNFVLNIMFGKGIFEYADGSVYEGDMRSGTPHGAGIYVTATGDKYIGDWVKGKRHGKGILTFRNEDRFEGEWKNNQIEEGSLFLNRLQSIYSGPFVNGKYHGKGRLQTTKGVFSGEFEAGKEVEGIFVSNDGELTYEGAYKNGFWNGAGVLKTKQFTYTGQFVRDLFEGKGIMEYSDGYIFDGNFLNGMRHGKGRFWHKGVGAQQPGVILSYNGEWHNDCRHGQADLVYANGSTYAGPVQNGQPHGNGKMILKNGTIVEGKFVNGVLEGKTDLLYNFGAEGLSVDETGVVCGDPYGMEYLVPPFLPLFQFQ